MEYSHPDAAYILALMRVTGVGVARAKALMDYYESAQNVWKEKSQALLTLPGLNEEIVGQFGSGKLLDLAKEELEWMAQHSIRMSFYRDADYPQRLADCTDCPVAVFYRGGANLNPSKSLAVVGTRRATEYGKQLTSSVIGELATLFVEPPTIVSGLAIGIDAMGHKAALNNNMATVAVLGHGLATIYPRYNRSLAVKILEQGGVLMTEYQHDIWPDGPNFVQRDRIIAGLSDATLVAESADKGGSLITASCALSYNRDVFAFPGRVSDVTYAGCNRLIRTNRAALVATGRDIASAMNWDVDAPAALDEPVQTNLFAGLTGEEKDVVRLLRKMPDGISANEIAKTMDVHMSKISSTLIQLEFKNKVRLLPGNLYVLVL